MDGDLVVELLLQVQEAAGHRLRLPSQVQPHHRAPVAGSLFVAGSHGNPLKDVFIFSVRSSLSQVLACPVSDYLCCHGWRKKKKQKKPPLPWAVYSFKTVLYFSLN